MAHSKPTFVVAWLKPQSQKVLDKHPNLVAPVQIWALGIEKPPNFLDSDLSKSVLSKRVENNINRIRTDKPRDRPNKEIDVKVQDSRTGQIVFDGEISLSEDVRDELENPEIESRNWRRI